MVGEGLINSEDSYERQNEKLRKIVDKLMQRVEQSTNDTSQSYLHFERSIILEDQVRLRTRDLNEALDVLNATNANLLAAQRETEKARRDLENAVEAIQEGFAIFDAHEKLLMKNSRFSALLPDVVEKIHIGMKFDDYVKVSYHSAHVILPDGMNYEACIDERLEAHQTDSANFTLPLKNDHWLHVSEQRMSDGGTIVLQTDITDQIRLEREERDRLIDRHARVVKATLEHIEQGVLIFDSNGSLVEWNRPVRRLLKLSPQLAKKGTRMERFRPLFMPNAIFVSKSYPERIYNWLQQGKGRSVFRADFVSVNGFEFSVSGQEMSDGATLISFNDITDLRNVFKELHKINETLEMRVEERTIALQKARDIAERANASKSRFVAAASHDLLQPVNAAKLFISSLSHTELNVQQKSIVDRIQLSFESVESILGALLDISKLDSGKAVLNISEFSLSSIFERIEEEFAPLAKTKGLEFRFVPTTAWVCSDPVYLRRIVQNLVSNAIRYTESGRLLLGARRRRENVEIWVCDTGIGIEKDEQELIFKEFHRGKTDQSEETAMGLGLAIVERACSMLEHEISVRSKVNEGSSFGVTVPYGTPEMLDFDFEDDSLSGSLMSMETALIVVIENDKQVRAAMERVLESWGAGAVVGASLEDVKMRIDELGITPDIFLIDYHLDDDRNGIEAIASLRKQYGPVFSVLLTADRSPELLNHAKTQGIFVRYKPVDVDELHMLIQGALASEA